MPVIAKKELFSRSIEISLYFMIYGSFVIPFGIMFVDFDIPLFFITFFFAFFISFFLCIFTSPFLFLVLYGIYSIAYSKRQISIMHALFIITVAISCITGYLKSTVDGLFFIYLIPFAYFYWKINKEDDEKNPLDWNKFNESDMSDILDKEL